MNLHREQHIIFASCPTVNGGWSVLSIVECQTAMPDGAATPTVQFQNHSVNFAVTTARDQTMPVLGANVKVHRDNAATFSSSSIRC